MTTELDTVQLLQAVQYTLNQVPNYSMRGCPHGFRNTYQLAAAVDEKLRWFDEINRTLDMSRLFKVSGCWGELHCDPETGEVVEYDRGGDWKQQGDGYDNIVRLNVDEWRAYWPKGDLFAGHDILDFGSWDTSGGYCGPEQEWRDELLKDKPELKKERKP